MDWGNYLERRGWWWIRDQLGIGQQGVRNCIVFACLTCVLSPSLLLLFITISSSSIIIISTLFQLENHSYLNMSSILFSWFSSHPLVRWDVGSEWVAVWCLVQSDCVQKEKGTTWNYHQEFSMKIRKTNHQNCYIQHAWGWPSKSVSWKSRLFYSKICKLSKKVTCARTCTQCKKWKEHPERGRDTAWSNSFWDGTEDRGRGCPDPLMAIHNVILHSQSPLELFWGISHESEQLKWLACDHWVY